MKRIFSILLVLLGTFGSATANTYVFTPNDGGGNTGDVWDLDHYYFYTWGINNFNIPADQVITEATLTFKNINNWTSSENGYWNTAHTVYTEQNWLHTWLLNSADNPGRDGSEQGYYSATGSDGRLVRYSDADGGPDNIASASWLTSKIKIGTYNDHDGGTGGDVINLTYNFSSLGLLDELSTYISTGSNFGIGFDSDCHYWNDGVKLTITTSRVPDGGTTALLMGFGFLALASIRRFLRA